MSLLLAIAVASGTAAGVFLEPSLGPARWLLALFGVGSFLLAARRLLTLAKWSCACAIAAGSLLLAADAQDRALHPPLRQLLEDRLGGFVVESIESERHDEPVQIEGRITTDAFPTESGASMRVQVDRASVGGCLEPAAGGVSLSVIGALASDALGEWRAGRTIRATAVLRRPARYLDAGVPDQERLLARRGIALVGSVKSAALVQVVARGSWIDETAGTLRAVVRTAIERHVAPHDRQSAAIAVAILIGDRGSLDPLVEQRLQEAGTYHVIAISGGNIAILAGLLLGALWMLGVRGGWAASGAIVLLAAYAYVAGGSPSVIRATVMAAIYLGLRIIDQRTAPLHAMALTLVVVLIASPLSVADVGLWLTFGATAAIIAGAGVVTLPRAAWIRPAVVTLLASLSAEVALMPIAAFVFQRVTVAGLAVNLVAIPCMAVVQIAAMVTAAADAVGWMRLAGLAGWVTHAGVVGLIESARLVDLAPWLTWRVPSPALPLIAFYYASLVIWIAATRSAGSRREPIRRPSLIGAVAALLWIIIAPQTLSRVFGDGRLHLTMMDVGQGDAMLVTLPNGKTLMVDTGGVSIRGDFDIGDRVLGPALRARGLQRLDYLAITHGDPDHIGGALSLTRDFSPREIWYGVYVNHHEPAMKLQEMAARTRSAWRWLQASDRMELGGVELRVHHPAIPDWQRQKVRNDDSVVIELRYGEVSMLLTGDIGTEVEQALLPTLDLLPIVVLKSPHHGSATSSSEEFVHKLKPRVVLISCGRANPYGHPVPRVMDRYQQVQSQVLRTDLDGQIEIVTDGESLTATTFTGRRVASLNTQDTKDTKGTDLLVPGAPGVPGAYQGSE